MKVEEQVCSLELARRLKELGTGQESLWFWSKGIGAGRLVLREPNAVGLMFAQLYEAADLKEDIAAFTVAELGQLLPKWVYICKDGTGFCAGYAMNPDPKRPMNEGMPVEMSDAIDGAKTEADARAKMLVCLFESKLMGEN